MNEGFYMNSCRLQFKFVSSSGVQTSPAGRGSTRRTSGRPSPTSCRGRSLASMSSSSSTSTRRTAATTAPCTSSASWVSRSGLQVTCSISPVSWKHSGRSQMWRCFNNVCVFIVFQMTKTFPVFLPCSWVFLRIILIRARTGPMTETSTVRRNASYTLMTRLLTLTHTTGHLVLSDHMSSCLITGLPVSQSVDLLYLIRWLPVCSSRCEQLPADGPQEHDVQTAAAAGQTLGDGAAEHLGSERPTGLSVCCLKPRPPAVTSPLTHTQTLPSDLIVNLHVLFKHLEGWCVPRSS